MQLSEHATASPLAGARVCERIVVFNKCDLVPEWGIEVWNLYLLFLALRDEPLTLCVACVSTAFSEGDGGKIS